MLSHEDHATLADVIVQTVQKAIAPMKAQIAELQTKQVALETRALSPEYRGTYSDGVTYARGSLVTKNGGLWLALADTTLPPGASPTAWRLIVKSGDAR